MQARPLLFSAVIGGIVLGAVAASAIPQLAAGPAEPAWRSLIQPQYQQAYTLSHGAGPEDSSAMGLAVMRPDDPVQTQLPPEYAAQERLAQQAAAQAERAYKLAYREAIALRPAAEPAQPASVRTEVDVSPEPVVTPEEAPVEAKVITVAALDSE